MYQPQPWYYSHAILMVFTWGTCSCHEFIIWLLFYFIFCPVFPPTVRCVGISISPHKSPVWGSHNTHSDHLIRSNLKNENALHIFLNRISRPLNDKYSNFFIISLFSKMDWNISRAAWFHQHLRKCNANLVFIFSGLCPWALANSEFQNHNWSALVRLL